MRPLAPHSLPVRLPTGATLGPSKPPCHHHQQPVARLLLWKLTSLPPPASTTPPPHAHAHPLPALPARQLMNMTRKSMRQEIVGARGKLAACGIPARDIVGFRAPYLDTNRYVRDTLAEGGFLYDRCACVCGSLEV